MDLGVAHAYNQWQACLKDAIHLNQLLGLPLKEPQIAWLFSGTVLHHLVMRLRKGVSPEQLFLGSPSSRRLFNSLLDTTLQYHPEGLSVPQQTPALDDLSDLFKNLQLLEVEAEEERAVGKSVVDYSCDKVLVKTRYRTKERSHKAQNPELFHKKERKGWD
ncbi:protein asteroid homolog 1-like [Lampris incognitus]|uniref:protein asteroid homolog 1-like n=1 Tax=Lampris incognitus TaxID=2546036 RepID=UPI0024B4CC88|nr:protein asteroid homolog 1-like [Lampris incognitus]